MTATLTIAELADISGKTSRSIQIRAKKEKWQFDEIFGRGRGGKIRSYPVDSLPEDIRLLYNKVNLENQVQQSSLTAPAAPLPAAAPAGDIACTDQPALCKPQLDKALAKADLLRLYTESLKRAPWGKKERARRDFMLAYNSGIAYPALFAALGAVRWKTIEDWKRIVKKGDALNLADRRGYWKGGRRVLNEQQQQVLLKCALHPNRPKIAEVIRMARAVMHQTGIANGHSDATYRRWLSDWKKHNHHIWVFIRQGAKQWNDQCAYYIERDYNLINVGDILVADGHVLNFEILNPWTGKPKRMALIVWQDMKSTMPLGWEIMPTENTQAIASALRRAILRLGKIPQVVYLDNGKAFSSRFFNGADLEQAGFAGLFERLGCKTIFAWPYHGQSKTVERFFGTFAELERWCPTYVGTSIDKKPPRLNQGEKLHRRVWDKLINGNCFTLEQAHRVIAAWFDEYARRPQTGHLCGRTPLELFAAGRGDGIDPYELRELMMSLEIRHIRRNGIRFLGQNYYSPKLYGRRHPVIIQYDLQDSSFIFVLDQRGDFICEARPVEKIHPAANILGQEEDREKLKQHIALKRRQEREAGLLARDVLETEVLPAHRKQLAALGIDGAAIGQPARPVKQLPQPVDDAKVAAELAELEALNQDQQAEKPAGEEYIPQVVNEAELERKRLEQMSEADRYEALLDKEIRGEMLSQQWQAFMRYFEMTPGYRQQQDYWEERRAMLSVAYQRAN